MSKFLSDRIFQFILRFILGGIFVYLAWGKMLHPDEFAKSICAYQMMPQGMVNFMAVLLPFVEFFAGLFMILGVYKKGSSFLIVLMLIMFMFGLAWAQLKGLSLNCGCGFDSPGETSNLPMRMLEDGVMLIGAMIVLNFCDKKIN